MLDRATDEAEILALIHRNRIAIWTQDYDLYETCFVRADYLTRWGWWREGGVMVRQGFDDIMARARAGGPPRNDANAFDTKVVNLSLQISGDMAWATFDQQYPANTDPGHPSRGLVREMRVFERHAEGWKIAFLGFLDVSRTRSGPEVLHLASDGTVLWRSPSIEAVLADSDDLVIRNGRLRFRNSRLDRQLQDALRWAEGASDSFTSYQGAVPIVTDAVEGEATRVYWVSLDAGMIVFTVGENRITPQRLKLAAAIYGLSRAQVEVAGLVAEGLSLEQMAERMAVTPNTARTHLNRVFDKTGVRTQAALVRVLLTAVAPL